MNMMYIFTFLMIFCFSKGSALTCYNCTYATELGGVLGSSATCQGPVVGAEHVVTCADGENYCTVQNVMTAIPGISQTTVITRGCSSLNAQACINLGFVSTCSTACNTNNCNTGTGNDSTRFGLNILFMALLVVFAQYAM